MNLAEVEKWQYKEGTGEVQARHTVSHKCLGAALVRSLDCSGTACPLCPQPEQYLIFLTFFLFHAAGVADFYAKKVGGGPAVRSPGSS